MKSMKKIAPLYALQAGWVRYKNRAGMYSAFTVLMFILSLVIAGFVTSVASVFSTSAFLERTIVALLTGIFGAMISMGWAHFARKDEKGLLVEFGDFFSGFKVNVRSLVAVTVIITLATQLLSLVVPEEIASFTLESNDGDAEELMMAFQDLQLVYSEHINEIAIYFFSSLLLGLLFMFAQYRASLEGDDPVRAIQWSMAHAVSNTINIIALLVLIVVLTAVITVFTLGLGLLVVIPWVTLSLYDAYDQLLPDVESVEHELDDELTTRDE